MIYMLAHSFLYVALGIDHYANIHKDTVTD